MQLRFMLINWVIIYNDHFNVEIAVSHAFVREKLFVSYFLTIKEDDKCQFFIQKKRHHSVTKMKYNIFNVLQLPDKKYLY